MMTAEVRRMCQRCNNTAKEIKALLQEGPSVDLARLARADGALRLFNDSLQRVTDMISVVTCAAEDSPARTKSRGTDSATRQRNTLLIAQLAAVTRALDARSKLISKALYTLRRQAEMTWPVPEAAPGAPSSADPIRR